MANAQPLGMYEVAGAPDSTVMDNIAAAGDVTEVMLNGEPPISELTSATVEVGQFVIHFDFPDAERRTRILLVNAADRMSFLSNELLTLNGLIIELTKERLYFAHLLGGTVANPDVGEAFAYLRSIGFSEEEAETKSVILPSAVQASIAKETV
jgi:hypothetical protein